jgi:hypothetical protein
MALLTPLRPTAIPVAQASWNVSLSGVGQVPGMVGVVSPVAAVTPVAGRARTGEGGERPWRPAYTPQEIEGVLETRRYLALRRPELREAPPASRGESAPGRGHWNWNPGLDGESLRQVYVQLSTDASPTLGTRLDAYA